MTAHHDTVKNQAGATFAFPWDPLGPLFGLPMSFETCALMLLGSIKSEAVEKLPDKVKSISIFESFNGCRTPLLY